MSRRSILRARFAEAARAGIDLSAPVSVMAAEPVFSGPRLARGQCPICLGRFGRGLRAHRDAGCAPPALPIVLTPPPVAPTPVTTMKPAKKRPVRRLRRRKG